MRRFLGLLAAFILLISAVPAFANGRSDFIGGLDLPLRQRIQMVLKREGLYAGRIDGRIGAGTEAAIRRYRTAKGIGDEREDGDDMSLYLTPKLIKAMFGVDIQPDEFGEIGARKQMELMRQLGLTPTPKFKRYVTDD